MTGAERIVTVSLGAATIVWGLIPGMTFYPGSLGLKSVKKTHVPSWFGRLWFTTIGLWIIYMGLRH